MLTKYPLHYQHLCPRELSGFDAKDLPRMISDGFVRKVFDSCEAVRGIENQKTQEEGEWHCVSYKLHKGTAENLAHLEKRSNADNFVTIEEKGSLPNVIRWTESALWWWCTLLQGIIQYAMARNGKPTITPSTVQHFTPIDVCLRPDKFSYHSVSNCCWQLGWATNCRNVIELDISLQAHGKPFHFSL